MRIFPIAQSVHLLFEHNESPYNRKQIQTPCPTCDLYKSSMNDNFYIKSNAWYSTEPPLTLTKLKRIPLYQLQNYDKK